MGHTHSHTPHTHTLTHAPPLVTCYTGSLRSPLATCLLIRYTSSLLHEDMSSTNARTSYQFLENCLRHKNEMVRGIDIAVHVIIVIIVTDNGTNLRRHGTRLILFKSSVFHFLLMQGVGHVCTTDNTCPSARMLYCVVGDLRSC
jgi:hypothetical protein